MNGKIKLELITLLFAVGCLPSYALEQDASLYPDNPFITDDALYVSGSGISRYTKDTFKKTWSALPELQTFEPVVTKGSVLVGSTNGLYAVDKDTGVVQWRVNSESPVFSPVALGEHVYAGSQDGILRAISLIDGNLVWRREFNGWIYPPVVDRDVLVIGGSEGKLHGLNANNGDVIWIKPLSQELVYRPVAATPGVALATTFSGDLIAFDVKNGQTIWRTRDPVAGFSPLVFEDRMYMGSFDGTLRVRNVNDGLLVWEYRFEDKLPYTPRIFGDTVLVGSDHGSVAAIDTQTGNPLWRKELRHTLASGPVLVNDKVIVVIEGGELFAWNDQAVLSTQ